MGYEARGILVFEYQVLYSGWGLKKKRETEIDVQSQSVGIRGTIRYQSRGAQARERFYKD